jgi:hypothetical protein
VFHTNEGHAGYLGLERIRELQDAEGLAFDEALAVVRAARSSPRTRRCPPASTGSRSTWCATTSTTPRSRRRCCPASHGRGARPRRRGQPEHVQHGPHGPAAGPAGERRLEAARRRSRGACSAPCGAASTPSRCRSAR